eukprot:7328918-Lingulodinium_polyedra.AAC.1
MSLIPWLMDLRQWCRGRAQQHRAPGDRLRQQAHAYLLHGGTRDGLAAELGITMPDLDALLGAAVAAAPPTTQP